MKRRIESSLVWDFGKCLFKKGLATNIPRAKSDNVQSPLLITKITVHSSQTKTAQHGSVYVEFDRPFEYRINGYFEKGTLLLMALSQRLYRDNVMNGRSGYGDKHFHAEFSLPHKSSGFCDEAIMRVLVMLECLGVAKDDIPPPVITQRTLVFVPEHHPLRNRHYHKWGWVEYGTYLGDLHGLSSEELRPQ